MKARLLILATNFDFKSNNTTTAEWQFDVADVDRGCIYSGVSGLVLQQLDRRSASAAHRNLVDDHRRSSRVK